MFFAQHYLFSLKILYTTTEIHFFFTKALKNCNFFLNTEVDFITMIQANWK